jgi:hypothetical protein
MSPLDACHGAKGLQFACNWAVRTLIDYQNEPHPNLASEILSQNRG